MAGLVDRWILKAHSASHNQVIAADAFFVVSIIVPSSRGGLMRSTANLGLTQSQDFEVPSSSVTGVKKIPQRFALSMARPCRYHHPCSDTKHL